MRKQILRIDAESGAVFSVRSDFEVRVGTKAKSGYVYVYADGKSKLAHRMVWESANGAIPAGAEIDHVNGIRDDNRLINLRLVDKSQNQQNQIKLRADNKSGVRGVVWHKRIGKWLAKIKVRGVCISLGYHDSLAEAAAAYQSGAAKYHTHNPAACGA